MPKLALHGVIDFLRRHALMDISSGVLLERYVIYSQGSGDGDQASSATKAEDAFAELVRRHGPKVYGVCRRILGDHQLAEDAFQATFVVLARKARTIQPPSAVGGFLYGVARKAALEALAMGRRRKETLVAHPPEAFALRPASHPSEDLALLDEEIANLSETHRAAIVLCELDGVSRAEAAKQLGIREGTLSSRLGRAREQLRKKLAKRGVTLSAGMFAALAHAAVPPGLSAATNQVAASVLPATVALIVQGVLRTMLLSKLTTATTLCVPLFLASTLGVGLISARDGIGPMNADRAAQAVPDGPATPQAKPRAILDRDPAPQFGPTPKRQPTAVGKLLERLDELRPKFGEVDEWAGALRDLIRLGPNAVPELIAELDATKDDVMVRCLGFVLRGIGDKRAIPALIRALPKTCVPSGSDCAFVAKDPVLLAFMQKHDNDERDQMVTHYSFGRSVCEVRATLQKLTGMKHGEDDLVNIMLQGTPRQKFLQRSHYQRCAERWANWWELHWKEHVADVRYARVKLTPLAEASPLFSNFPQGPEVKIAGRHPGHILESVRNPKAKHVFLDLDTGREAALPNELRAPAGQPERLDDILAWAAREGFDLMGTEYQVPGEQKSHYVLRGLGLTTWQIKTERWKTLERELGEDGPLDMGTRTDGLLARFDLAKKQYVPEETATFLYQTREGGFGALFVGVEVHDNSLKPGGFLPADDDLHPVAFFKGRRFAFALIAGPDDRAREAGGKK